MSFWPYVVVVPKLRTWATLAPLMTNTPPLITSGVPGAMPPLEDTSTVLREFDVDAPAVRLAGGVAVPANKNPAAMDLLGGAAGRDVFLPCCEFHRRIALAVPEREVAMQCLQPEAGGPVEAPAGVRCGDGEILHSVVAGGLQALGAESEGACRSETPGGSVTEGIP